MEVELINESDLPRMLLRCDTAAGTCVSEDIPRLGAHTYHDGQEFKLNHLHAAMKSGHMSVLEHCTLTFAIEGISRVCSHQLVRHRLMSFEQLSQRYVRMDGAGYVMPGSIKCKSMGTIYDPFEGRREAMLEEEYGAIMRNAFSAYRRLIEKYGIPEEDARYVLPNACCTNIVVSMNLREFMHFCGLRRCLRAQWEIRELADRMAEEVIGHVPWLKDWLGPQCEGLGYCPEVKSCGRTPRKRDVVDMKDTKCPALRLGITSDGTTLEWV